MTPHLFTVDVEDYFHVNAFESMVRRDTWSEYSPRTHVGTDQLLDLLAAHGATGTFFVLGWVAKHQPALVRRIHEAGHEVASHTFWHRRLPSMSPEEFRRDLLDSRAAIEDACGERIVGFRAPSFSLVPGTEWVFDELLEAGFSYDSSVFPIRRPDYGYPDAPTAPYEVRRSGGSLTEFPLSVLRIAGTRVPAAGGGYLRHFPLGILQRAFRQAGRSGEPGVFYVHPWELDPDQPRLAVGTLTRVRHYRGLRDTASRIGLLLDEFRFCSIRDWFALQAPSRAPVLEGSP